MANKTTNIEAATSETDLGDASPQSRIGKYLEGLASQIETRYRKRSLRSRTFAIDYNFAENGADGTIYQCNKMKDHQAALDAGLRIRGEKVVINTEASLMDGKDFGSIHLSRFQSGDPMALILSLVRGLAIGNVAANRGRTGHSPPPAVKTTTLRPVESSSGRSGARSPWWTSRLSPGPGLTASWRPWQS
jgi:hypothetical protein